MSADTEREIKPGFGDLFTVEAFAASCLEGSFVDYDGVGYYSNGKTYDIEHRVYCMDVVAGLIDIHWKYIIWFNK